MNATGRQMGTSCIVPALIWPLTSELAALIDKMQRLALVNAGCHEDTIEFELWEYGNYAPLNKEPVMGYARLATGLA